MCLLGLFLAGDAAHCLRAGLQAGGRNGGVAVGAQAVAPGLDAAQGCGYGCKFGCFPLAQGEFEFALGGHLGRTGDGPPGWQTLWLGRRSLRLLVEGVNMAAQLLDE